MSRRNRKGRRSQGSLSRGIISISRKGYGFVDTPEGEYFILGGHLRGAMDGDTVEVVRLRSLETRRQQGARRGMANQRNTGEGQAKRDMLGGVKRIIGRAHSTVVGTLRLMEGLGVVVPLDERIRYDFFLDSRAALSLKAREGDLVVVRITRYPSHYEPASGYIEEIIGHETDRDTGIEVIIREHSLETQFSAAALEEAEALVPPSLDDKGQGPIRRDLRDRFIFSIDPADARDHDDALSVDFIDGHIRLGVHIADVSTYVDWDSAIDLDARRRATSVYLPDRVIPMLPLHLSEDLCSLKPHELRYAFTVDILMQKNGSVVSTELYPSLICSSMSLSYDEVLCMLDIPDADSAEGPKSPIVAKLKTMKKLAHRLNKRRLQQGAIEFDSLEAKTVLDEHKRPIEVILRARNDATAIVEEAMILANEQVAAYMLTAPMIYRIHEEPLQEDLDDLLVILQEFGYARQGAPQSSREIQAILEACRDTDEYHLISSLLLRAMKRARYAPFFSTHFGLASAAYTHFTAPIRRYPDLMVHRLLKCQLMGEQVLDSMQRQLDWICEHSSTMEREAERVSYEATALKLCEFLEPRVGEEFSAIVVSMNTSGLFVREETTTAEGFIDRETLPGTYTFDMKGHRYHNLLSHDQLRLGQRLNVVLKAVDVKHARPHFVIA